MCLKLNIETDQSINRSPLGDMSLHKILKQEWPDTQDYIISEIIFDFAVSHPAEYWECSPQAIANYIIGVGK